MKNALAVIGTISTIERIPDADRIVQATVTCGSAGTWRGVVGLDTQVGQKVYVFLQDALLPEGDPRWAFMEKSKWRVRMSRFRGAMSECLMIPGAPDLPDGTDIAAELGVGKYEKTVPATGDAIGDFPPFIPKTDEINMQVFGEDELLKMLRCESGWLATLKYDGSSCTVWNDEDGKLRVASRTLELREFNEVTGKTSPYWSAVRRCDMTQLPAGCALQFEVCGPGLQKNPVGLAEVQGFGFILYDYLNHRARPHDDLAATCAAIGMACAAVVTQGNTPDAAQARSALPTLRECADSAVYPNGKPAEGIVVKAADGSWSFKVLNLNYKD